MKNYTQEIFAIRLDISQKQFSRIENGEVSPTISMLFKICQVLEVEPSFLLEFDSRKIFHNNSINQSGGEFIAYNDTSIKDVKILYERLLSEKDEIIGLLKKGENK
jgi:transcriptional regulator with XRE-family HTH domain